MNLGERVEKLERDNKRLKRYVAASISIALSALIGGTVLGGHADHENFDNIYAKNIFLIDDNGKIRVKLQGADGSLKLYNSSGINKIKLKGDNGKITRVSEASW